MRSEWKDFVGGKWETQVDVRDFIQKNYTLYEGDEEFLAGPTEATKTLWAQVMDLTQQEREAGGVLGGPDDCFPARAFEEGDRELRRLG